MLVTLSGQRVKDHSEAPEKLYYNTHRSMTEDDEANYVLPQCISNTSCLKTSAKYLKQFQNSCLAPDCHENPHKVWRCLKAGYYRENR